MQLSLNILKCLNTFNKILLPPTGAIIKSYGKNIIAPYGGNNIKNKNVFNIKSTCMYMQIFFKIFFKKKYFLLSGITCVYKRI